MTFIIIDTEESAVKNTKNLIKELSYRFDTNFKIKVFNGYNQQLLSEIKNNETQKLYIIANVLNGNKSGIEIAQLIRKYDINSKIIFLTNYSELFNPVHEQVRSVYHFITKGQNFKSVLAKDILKIIDMFFTQRFEYHTVHNDISLNYKAITYISRDKEERKLIIHTDNNAHKVNMTFKEINCCLDHRFKMSHRACIVNTDRVENYDWQNKDILLDNGQHVPYLSKKYKEELIDEN